MLAETELAILIVLVVQIVKSWRKLDKNQVGLFLILAGALFGISNAAANLWLPVWLKTGIGAGVALAIKAGGYYGIFKLTQKGDGK